MSDSIVCEAPALRYGWRSVRLADIAPDASALADGPFGSKLKTDHYAPSGARVIRLQNIGRGVFLDRDKAFISLEHFATLKRHDARPGDVVVAALGDGATPAGRACIVPDDIGPALVKADCFRIRLPSQVVAPEFLAAFLNSPQTLATASEQMRGATRPRFTLKMLRDLRLPVPPIGDQRRISARLKERTTEAAKARAAAEAQLAGLDALQAALLREVFCGSAASEWPVSALGDVCEIQLGKMLSPASKKGISPKPYLRNTNVQWTRFDLRDVATMDFDEDEQRKFRLRPRDLLVCEGGEPGRAAVWAGEITECYYQKALHRLRPRGNAIDPYFVLYRLRLGGLTGEFTESHAKSTIAHLPAVRLAQLSINLPRLAEQQRIADRLREQFVEIERARAAAKSQLKTIAALPGAYLREAFAVNV